MFKRRLLPVLLSSLALATVAAAPVAAVNGPERFSDTLVLDGTEVWAECDGFDVVLDGITIERRFLWWKDDDGNILVERRHVYFHGPMVNSETGESVEYIGRFTRVVDNEAQTEALYGLSRMIHVPGTGVLAMAAGSIGWDLTVSEDEPAFDNGQSLFRFEAEVADALCAALG